MIEDIPSITIDKAVLSPNVTFMRWKVHQDWVTQVVFYLSMSMKTSSTKKYIYVQFIRMSIKAVHQQIYFHCELIILENTEQLTILSLYR